ncbi:TlpA family protein disulfide reductase [Georgenia thermotolerans]|uniref:Redoxin family protein n=1 Tax=Georgenia thermotolerans TaxID=527326 RepID=A0A7J5UQG4_9MICO|nr:TlpA disulfide reductase family protein [Georgenia thermotolerans]KAE8764364.1 redoxin family protein [Georgenia thermotolerans]
MTPGAGDGRRALSRRTLLRAIGAGAAALALAACSPGGTGTSAAGAGYVAGDGSFATWKPDERGAPVAMTGTTYTDEQVDVATWRGDVVVLNFWYAACPPCRAEAPELRAIAEDYGDRGVHLLGVNPRDDAGAAQAFERTFEIPYPSIHDSDARAVASLEGLVPLQAMPSTVVLDRQGRVAARILGEFDPQVLRGLIDDTLAEKA